MDAAITTGCQGVIFKWLRLVRHLFAPLWDTMFGRKTYFCTCMVMLPCTFSQHWVPVRIYILHENKMGVGTTCLTSMEFAPDNRQLSNVLYVHTTAWKKKKTMPCVSGGVVRRLVRFYLLPFHKCCLSFVLVCSHIWSLLFMLDRRWRQRCSNAQSCSSPQKGLVCLRGATDSKICSYNYTVGSRLYVTSACVLQIRPPF